MTASHSAVLSQSNQTMVCWIQFNSVHYETECQMIWKLICLILKLSLNSKQGQLIFILDPMSRSYIYTELDSQYWKQKLSPGTGLFVWVINRCTCMISVWSKIQIIKPSAPDNYLANQYSTDENSPQHKFVHNIFGVKSII